MTSFVHTAALLLLLGWTATLGAESKTFTLTVGPVAADRTNAVVRASIVLPPALAKARNVALKGPDGALPAQLTDPGLYPPKSDGETAREIHFILPRLDKDKTVELEAVISTDPPGKAEAFRIVDVDKELTELRWGDRPVVQYVHPSHDGSSKEKHDATFKPFHHVFDPGTGKKLLTNGPGGRYPHHRGIFFGYNRITYGGNQVDTWHGKDGAHQQHEKFLAKEAGPVLGRLRSQIAWNGVQRNGVFALEDREVTVYNLRDGTLIDFATRLKAKKVGKVQLDGDPQHSGVQFRAANEVNDNVKETYFIRPDGKGKDGEERNWDPKDKDSKRNKDTKKQVANLSWDAMSFLIDGDRYTVAYLDLPTNPKDAYYSERTYGRFGAYFTCEVGGAKDLQARYRFWVQKGEMTVEQIAALSEDFVKPVPVNVKAR